MIPVDSSVIPEGVKQKIETRLLKIEKEHNVRFILAVESGSRAWGFPSPDSDYDIRFIYVKPRDEYLTLSPIRDVLELPIEDDIDLNGWDIRKALGLLLKSNAVVSEWMCSPIRYRDDHPIVPALREFSDRSLDPNTLARHYASIAKGASVRWLNGEEEPAVKKYFYALRPALAIRFLRENAATRPPMNLQQLMSALTLSESILIQINELIEAKKITNELSNTKRFPDLDKLIVDELSRVHEIASVSCDSGFQVEANKLFLGLVNGDFR